MCAQIEKAVVNLVAVYSTTKFLASIPTDHTSCLKNRCCLVDSRWNNDRLGDVNRIIN